MASTTAAAPVADSASRMAGSTRLGRIALWVTLALVLVVILFPFYWMIITSFKTYEQIRSLNTPFIPNPFDTSAYYRLFFEKDFGLWYRNSLIVAVVVTPLTVAVSTLAAYALVRLKFIGAATLATVILVTYLIPGSLLVIPLYQVIKNLGLINNLASLWVVYPTFSIPFATWLLMGYVQSLPSEIDEAALIDGASRLQTLWYVVLPMMAPALLAVFLFTFTGVWNEYFFAFVLLSSQSNMTLPIGMTFMVLNDIFQWPDMMAAAVLITLPVVIPFVYTQRYMVEGLAAGGVKG
jgi:multiple sugar transport system permease protein